MNTFDKLYKETGIDKVKLTQWMEKYRPEEKEVIDKNLIDRDQVDHIEIYAIIYCIKILKFEWIEELLPHLKTKTQDRSNIEE